MASVTVEQFLAGVKRSGLIEPDRFAEFLQSHPRMPPTPERLAELLLNEGLLTRFHVKHMLVGKFAGFVLGQYRVLERIGAGGAGVIFRAEHSTLCRQVAIKVLPPTRAADEESLKRFYREARLVAALDHPNIVRAYDAAKANGIHYLAMEFIEGSDLEKLVRRDGPLSVELASRYIAQASAGLQHAHERGLVHRDIKPANLLIDAGGALRILDLGLARFFTDSKDGLTTDGVAGAVIGTADYMSPEQAMDSHEVDIRGDIYSLGATFYMLLAGRAPFSKSSMTQKLLAHQMREPEPLTDLRPDVPMELANVISKMMAKIPDNRFQTPAEVVDALSLWSGLILPEAASGSLVSGGLSSSSRKPRTLPLPEAVAPTTPLRSRPMLLAGAGLALVAVVWAGAASLGGSSAKPTPSTFAPDSARADTVTLTNVEPPSADPMQVGRYEGHSGDIESAIVMKDRKAILTSSADGSLRLWNVRTRSQLRKFDGHNSAVHTAAFSPKEDSIASGDESGLILIHDAATARETARIQTAKAVRGLRFTADGKSAISFGSDGVGRLWDIATRTEMRTFAGHTDAVAALEMSADGKSMWTAGYDRHLIGWDVETGRHNFDIAFEGTNRLGAIALSPDENDLLVAASGPSPTERTPTVFRIDVRSGRIVRKWDLDSTYAVAFAPDGKQFACVGRDARVRVYRLWEDRPSRDFVWSNVPGYCVEWKDEGTLVIGGKRSELDEWTVGSR